MAENKILIYVAGNPDAYPLEYYDTDSENYAGVIPRLLEQFSAQSNYQVVYYDPGEKDQREQLAGNLQVDLLSGYTEGDPVPDGGEKLLLFRTVSQDEELSYYLCATEVAPENFIRDLSAFLSAVSQERVTGLLLETAAEAPKPVPTAHTLALWGVVLALALLAAAAGLLARHYRKALKTANQELERDKDTGLGNVEHLKHYCRRFINDKNRILYSLMYFYVDTDSLHRQAGNQDTDDVLRWCAEVLKDQVTQTGILVRAAENGFAVLRLSVSQERTAEWIATVLEKIRSYPLENAKAFQVGAAVGVYPLTMDGQDLDEIIFDTAQEARRALDSHEDCLFFTHETQNRIRMEQELRATVARALDSNEFQLYVQFYVDAHTSRVVGGEALSRWLHPRRGLLLPGTFVPALEREGLTYKLDYHCLSSSCGLLQELWEHGVNDFFLSCNFSRETFAAPDFVERCQEIVGSYTFPRKMLVFELTESVSTQSGALIQSNMQRLRNYGIRSVLDDFGEGFTSFSDLQEYQVDGIKLDKGLIDNILTEKTNAILRAMVQIGHEMGLTILAEGVETEEQARALREIRCDVIQGYHFHAPIPRAEVADRLLSQTATVP